VVCERVLRHWASEPAWVSSPTAGAMGLLLLAATSGSVCMPASLSVSSSDMDDSGGERLCGMVGRVFLTFPRLPITPLCPLDLGHDIRTPPVGCFDWYFRPVSEGRHHPMAEAYSSDHRSCILIFSPCVAEASPRLCYHLQPGTTMRSPMSHNQSCLAPIYFFCICEIAILNRIDRWNR
jgi:hypothetical protein